MASIIIYIFFSNLNGYKIRLAKTGGLHKMLDYSRLKTGDGSHMNAGPVVTTRAVVLRLRCTSPLLVSWPCGSGCSCCKAHQTPP